MDKKLGTICVCVLIVLAILAAGAAYLPRHLKKDWGDGSSASLNDDVDGRSIVPVDWENGGIQYLTMMGSSSPYSGYLIVTAEVTDGPSEVMIPEIIIPWRTSGDALSIATEIFGMDPDTVSIDEQHADKLYATTQISAPLHGDYHETLRVGMMNGAIQYTRSDDYDPIIRVWDDLNLTYQALEWPLSDEEVRAITDTAMVADLAPQGDLEIRTSMGTRRVGMSSSLGGDVHAISARYVFYDYFIDDFQIGAAAVGVDGHGNVTHLRSLSMNILRTERSVRILTPDEILDWLRNDGARVPLHIMGSGSLELTAMKPGYTLNPTVDAMYVTPHYDLSFRFRASGFGGYPIDTKYTLRVSAVPLGENLPWMEEAEREYPDPGTERERPEASGLYLEGSPSMKDTGAGIRHGFHDLRLFRGSAVEAPLTEVTIRIMRDGSSVTEFSPTGNEIDGFEETANGTILVTSVIFAPSVPAGAIGSSYRYNSETDVILIRDNNDGVFDSEDSISVRIGSDDLAGVLPGDRVEVVIGGVVAAHWVVPGTT